MIDYGQIAFEAYSQHMKGKTYDDKPIPAWEELPANVRDGWRVTALLLITTQQKEFAEELYKLLVTGRYTTLESRLAAVLSSDANSG